MHFSRRKEFPKNVEPVIPPRDRGGEGGAAAAGRRVPVYTLRAMLQLLSDLAATDEEQLQLDIYDDLKPIFEKHLRFATKDE